GCVRSFGRIDILVNVVGVARVGGPVALSEEDWHLMLDTNVTSMFLTLKHVLPVMEAQGGGSVVNISSLASIRSSVLAPLFGYAATKAAVNQLTQTAALEYASRKIRINAILPGFMNTPTIVEPYKEVFANVDEMIETRNKQCPTGSMGDGWDVAYAALYLASDEAKYVIGHQLVVDGGISCRF
ncbi:MAG: SDR family NAD(P)-dependent oxidoreductase, partial [Deferrisomatales bacterium]